MALAVERTIRFTVVLDHEDQYSIRRRINRCALDDKIPLLLEKVMTAWPILLWCKPICGH